MNAPDFAKLFSNLLPSAVGIAVGVVVVHALFRRTGNIESVRRRLGRSLQQFAKVPAERLNHALADADRSLGRGWSAVVSAVILAVVVFVPAFSLELYRAMFPEMPRWHGYVVAAVVVSPFGWALHRLERRALLHRLEYLHHLPPSEYLPDSAGGNEALSDH